MKSRSLLLIILLFLFIGPVSVRAGTLSRAPNNLGLVGYWSLNEGAGAQVGDASGYKNNGTWSGSGSRWTTGKYGSGGTFNGTDDYVDVGSSDSLHPQLPITVSVWVKMPNVNVPYTFFSSDGDNGYAGVEIGSVGSGGQVEINFGDGGTSGAASRRTKTAATTITNDTWYHLVGVYRGATDMTIYINGVDAGGSYTGTGGALAYGRTTGKIGANSWNSSWYSGQIDDVRIYSRELSAADVAALYQSGFAQAGASSADLTKGTTLENGLVGLWTMDGVDTTWGSNRMTDRSTTGVVTTMISMSTTSSPIPGEIGQALKFDGVNDSLSAASNAALNPSELSISMWLKYPSNVADVNNSVIEKGGNTGWRIRCGSLSPCGLQFIFNSTFGATTNDFTMNAWTHVVLVANSTGSRFYVNGVAGTLDTDPYVASAAGSALTMGSGDLGFMNGFMDDVRVYNRSLSVNEINQLYRLGQATSNSSTNKTGGTLDSGLVGLWSFDGPDINWGANTVIDRSSTGNNGTMVNMSTSSSPAMGKFGQGLKFDGSNDYVQMPTNTAYNTALGTWSVWVKVNNAPAGNGDLVMARGDSDSSSGIGLGMSGGVFGAFINTTGAVNVCGATGVTPITTNVWHLLTFTFSQSNGGAGTLYLDGNVEATCTNSAAWTFNSQAVRLSDPLDAYWEVYDGIADDVRIYNRNLSAQEVKNLYNMGR